MEDFVSHSSSVGRLWIHLAFKVKYCHKIFGIPAIKVRSEQLLREAIIQLDIQCRELGIDQDHVHFVLDIGLEPLPKIIKKLKGYTAKRLFQEYPWLKKQYFWGSGLWNPSYYFDSLGRDIDDMSIYVRKQGMPKDQKTLPGLSTTNRGEPNSTGLMNRLPVTGG
jgi:putative transposase